IAGGSVHGTKKAADITFRREPRRQGDVPDRTMGSSVLGSARSRVPRPLVHGDEPHAGLLLDQRLRPVAMVDVPVDDQDPVDAMAGPGVVGGDGDASEEAETHGPRPQRVVPW